MNIEPNVSIRRKVCQTEGRCAAWKQTFLKYLQHIKPNWCIMGGERNGDDLSDLSM